ncbi:hypothetical protein J4E91_005635 [Alternaria rosae]|nr:hypothetical protein J4E91_005635 [Alternaria rosae]
MENTWGVQPASSGMNFSAAPAAAIWWDMCPIGAQQFQGSANETLPTRTHKPLADVLEEIGIGSTNGSHTVLDIEAFTDSLGGRPIYSRFVLGNAADQLTRARSGQDVTLLDCYGKPFFLPGEIFSSFDEAPVLFYSGIHELTEIFQADDVRPALPVFLRSGERQEVRTDRVDTSHLRAGDSLPESPELHSRPSLAFIMDLYGWYWRSSGAPDILHHSLRELVHTARISNIVCIGLGTLEAPDLAKARSLVQHMTASFIAYDLEQLYEAEGIPLEKPIKIIAQDPAYTSLDRMTLSALAEPIEVVSDPQGFLAINEGSLVFSSWPSVPVKQLIADLATELPDGKGPAALFLNNDRKDKYLGDMDVARYGLRRYGPVRYINAETKAYVEMLESYTRVFDGEQQFGIGFTGFEWFPDMDIWGREE